MQQTGSIAVLLRSGVRLILYFTFIYILYLVSAVLAASREQHLEDQVCLASTTTDRPKPLFQLTAVTETETEAIRLY